MLGTTRAKTPKEYIESLPDPRRSEMKALHKLITRTAPALKPKLWGGTIGYGQFHYRYATGREGDWFVVGLANRKDGISFYSCLTDGKQYIAEKHKKDLPKADIGRSCIRFKRLADIDLRVLARIIKENVAAAKKMAKK
ncbi:MAG TPA: DUF1801 domain-containing protein [Candidatus Xenobia bacterium]|nr:DUF1801 domain-containing protein [Candidatus Xenobia bacterium]